MRTGIEDMHRLQELVRMHRQGVSAKRRARELGMCRKTERRYRLRIDEAGLLEGPVDDLPEMAELRGAVACQTSPPAQEVSSVARWAERIEDKLRSGVGPTAIHAWLVEQDPTFDGSLSAVKRFTRKLRQQDGIKPGDVAIPIITPAGQDAQVDFGFIGWLVDPQTGKRRKAWVFVMVLAHSRLMYAEVVFSQDIDTWLALHGRAFAAFGGVPHVVVPDNLKAAVVRAAFKAEEMSTLNRSYRELARHYGFRIDPTPAYQPQKKGKVESGVKYVKNAFFKPRADELVELEATNARLAKWVAEVANQRIHGTTREVPARAFAQREQSELLGLPDQPYVPIIWYKARVQRDCHVQFERRMYSVPWEHVGKEAWLRVRGEAITIFVDDEREADHRRSGDGVWSTKKAHLPEGRRDFAERDPQHWYDRADALGPDVGDYARAVMRSDEVQLPLRRLQSIIPALEAIVPQRAEAVARRAARFGCYRPDGVRRIISQELDALDDSTTWVSPKWATQPRFARQAEDFLQAVGGRHGDC